MKKILLLMLLVATSCADKSNTAQSVIKVGICPEYPPFEFLENGQYSGFNVEVITKAMEVAGLEFEFIGMTFDGLLPALQSKKIDLVLGASSTAARREVVNFTISYTVPEPQVLLVHKNSLGAVTPDNLPGKSLGVLSGSFQETIARGLEGVNVTSYNSFTGAVLDLNSQKIDAALVSKNPSKEYLAQNPNLAAGGNIKNTFSDGYAIALNKEDVDLKDKLDVAIQKLLDDGTVDELAEKYKIYE